MTLWTHSFDPKQSPTCHLPKLAKTTGVEILLTALRNYGFVLKVPTDSEAELRAMLVPSIRRKIGLEFRGLWNPTQQVLEGGGSGAEAL